MVQQDIDDPFSFVRTGPESSGGKYIRRFWHPVYLSVELKSGQAKCLKILGEVFTLYRDEKGVAHMVAARCAHRRALLSLGWVEGESIRCRYHGWKFDSNGQCSEQPAEVDSFASKVKIDAYPTVEHLGLIFAYFGPTPAPQFSLWTEVDRNINFVNLRLERNCNYFQHLEGLFDDVHFCYLHPTSFYRKPEWGTQPPPDPSSIPEISAEETEYGLLQRSKTSAGLENKILMLMPNCVLFSSAAGKFKGSLQSIWVVPKDDESHYLFLACLVPSDSTEEFKKFLLEGADYSKMNEITSAVLDGAEKIEDLSGKVLFEDAVIQDSQGVIVDRSKEKLGKSDIAIIKMRQVWRRELKALSIGAELTDFKQPTKPGIPDRRIT